MQSRIRRHQSTFSSPEPEKHQSPDSEKEMTKTLEPLLLLQRDGGRRNFRALMSQEASFNPDICRAREIQSLLFCTAVTPPQCVPQTPKKLKQKKKLEHRESRLKTHTPDKVKPLFLSWKSHTEGKTHTPIKPTSTIF